MSSQEFTKCNRIVMCLVVRTVEQGYRSFFLGLDNGPPPIRVCLEFREIPAAEFAPRGWIVAEPLSQFCARSKILKPSIHFRFILPNPSRSEERRVGKE